MYRSCWTVRQIVRHEVTCISLGSMGSSHWWVKFFGVEKYLELLHFLFVFVRLQRRPHVVFRPFTIYLLPLLIRTSRTRPDQGKAVKPAADVPVESLVEVLLVAGRHAAVAVVLPKRD